MGYNLLADIMGISSVIITHPSNNRAHRRATMLINTNTLPLSHATTITHINSFVNC